MHWRSVKKVVEKTKRGKLLFSDERLSVSSAAVWPTFGCMSPSKTRADALHHPGVPEVNRWGSSGTGNSERRVTLDELMAPAER